MCSFLYRYQDNAELKPSGQSQPQPQARHPPHAQLPQGLPGAQNNFGYGATSTSASYAPSQGPQDMPDSFSQRNNPHVPSNRTSNSYAAQMRQVSGGPMHASLNVPQSMNVLNSPVHFQSQMRSHALIANAMGVNSIERGAEVSRQSHAMPAASPPDPSQHPSTKNTNTANGSRIYKNEEFAALLLPELFAENLFAQATSFNGLAGGNPSQAANTVTPSAQPMASNLNGGVSISHGVNNLQSSLQNGGRSAVGWAGNQPPSSLNARTGTSQLNGSNGRPNTQQSTVTPSIPPRFSGPIHGIGLQTTQQFAGGSAAASLMGMQRHGNPMSGNQSVQNTTASNWTGPRNSTQQRPQIRNPQAGPSPNLRNPLTGTQSHIDTSRFTDFRHPPINAPSNSRNATRISNMPLPSASQGNNMVNTGSGINQTNQRYFNGASTQPGAMRPNININTAGYRGNNPTSTSTNSEMRETSPNQPICSLMPPDQATQGAIPQPSNQTNPAQSMPMTRPQDRLQTHPAQPVPIGQGGQIHTNSTPNPPNLQQPPQENLAQFGQQIFNANNVSTPNPSTLVQHPVKHFQPESPVQIINLRDAEFTQPFTFPTKQDGWNLIINELPPKIQNAHSQKPNIVISNGQGLIVYLFNPKFLGGFNLGASPTLSLYTLLSLPRTTLNTETYFHENAIQPPSIVIQNEGALGAPAGQAQELASAPEAYVPDNTSRPLKRTSFEAGIANSDSDSASQEQRSKKPKMDETHPTASAIVPSATPQMKIAPSTSESTATPVWNPTFATISGPKAPGSETGALVSSNTQLPANKNTTNSQALKDVPSPQGGTSTTGVDEKASSKNLTSNAISPTQDQHQKSESTEVPRLDVDHMCPQVSTQNSAFFPFSWKFPEEVEKLPEAFNDPALRSYLENNSRYFGPLRLPPKKGQTQQPPAKTPLPPSSLQLFEIPGRETHENSLKRKLEPEEREAKRQKILEARAAAVARAHLTKYYNDLRGHHRRTLRSLQNPDKASVDSLQKLLEEEEEEERERTRKRQSRRKKPADPLYWLNERYPGELDEFYGSGEVDPNPQQTEKETPASETSKSPGITSVSTGDATVDAAWADMSQERTENLESPQTSSTVSSSSVATPASAGQENQGYDFLFHRAMVEDFFGESLPTPEQLLDDRFGTADGKLDLAAKNKIVNMEEDKRHMSPISQ
jgi:hypothetical protein